MDTCQLYKQVQWWQVDTGQNTKSVDMNKVNNTLTTEQLSQVNKCLFNGNYKLGKLCGGFHKVENVKQRNIELPEKLPVDATSFLYMNNNIVLYVASGKLYVNTQASGHLTDIQKTSVQYIMDNNKLPVENVAIEWQGKSGNKLDLSSKVSSMLS